MNGSILLLTSSAGSSGDQTMILILWGLIFVVAYFFLIRPQAKKARDQRSFSDAIEKGKQVVTTGGIHGKVTKIEDNVVTILVDTKTYLKLERGAISMEMTKAAYGEEAK
ncbi:MAG: preprotein translocase subunit YajC [Bacteroidota bacterium]